MATRGTALLITNENVFQGPEFNGDMYEHGNGDKYLKGLSEIANEKEFEQVNNNLNDYYYGYDKKRMKMKKHNRNSLCNDKNIMSIDVITQNKDILSDWVFIKNTTNKSVKFEIIDKFYCPATQSNYRKNISIRAGEVVRLYYGQLLPGMNRIA